MSAMTRVGRLSNMNGKLICKMMDPQPAATAHLRARNYNNPTEMIRVGDTFRKLGMWVPSARAYGEARQIFIKRRSSGKVKLCDERLVQVEHELLTRVPWYPREGLRVSAPVRLTQRELDISALIAEGLTNREIGERLNYSTRTVESHVASARAKFGAANRQELGRMYLSQLTDLEAIH